MCIEAEYKTWRCECMTFVLRCQTTNLAAEALTSNYFSNLATEVVTSWRGWLRKGEQLGKIHQGSILDPVQELRGAKLLHFNILPSAVIYSWSQNIHGSWCAFFFNGGKDVNIFFTSLVPATGFSMGRISSWNSLLYFGCIFWRI